MKECGVYWNQIVATGAAIMGLCFALKVKAYIYLPISLTSMQNSYSHVYDWAAVWQAPI